MVQRSGWYYLGPAFSGHVYVSFFFPLQFSFFCGDIGSDRFRLVWVFIQRRDSQGISGQGRKEKKGLLELHHHAIMFFLFPHAGLSV